MTVQGRDCYITIKTEKHEFDVPYSEETIREAVSLLQEEASIEGEGQCKAIVKKSGVTGCFVTPLTLETVPFLLYLAFGHAEKPLYVSETRNTHCSTLNLIPMEDTECFDLIQNRGNEKRVFEDCRINSFELRIENDEAIKLKLDICGERSAKTYLYTDDVAKTTGERFKSNRVSYFINDKLNLLIYGITLSVKKVGGTKTEIWIKRISPIGNYLPEKIEELKIVGLLLLPKSERSNYGLFNIILNDLVLVSDETNVNAADTVIDPLRYYVSGSVTAGVFTTSDEVIA